MTTEQNEHLARVKTNFTELATDKYIKGQSQHGGNLWEKKNLIDMAIDEAIDQVIYLLTLKEQIENKTLYTVSGEDSDK